MASKSATRPVAWLRHTQALAISPSLGLALYFCLGSLSALTTDGVLIKSSRNITVSKQCSACQFHNCWVLIQALTCSIQIGREPTVPAPTGSSLLARSCAVCRQPSLTVEGKLQLLSCFLAPGLENGCHLACHQTWSLTLSEMKWLFKKSCYLKKKK